MSEEKTCPTCESPLTTDARREGRCQCCGYRLNENESEEPESA